MVKLGELTFFFFFILRESGCQTHAVTCGAGTGVFLLIRVSYSLLMLIEFWITSLLPLSFLFAFHLVLWIFFLSYLDTSFPCFLLSSYFSWILNIYWVVFVLAENNNPTTEICTSSPLAFSLLRCFWWGGKFTFWQIYWHTEQYIFPLQLRSWENLESYIIVKKSHAWNAYASSVWGGVLEVSHD